MIKLRPYQMSDRSFFLGLVKDQDRMRFMDGALRDNAAEQLFQSLLPGCPRSQSAWIAIDSGSRIGHGAIVDTGEVESPEILFMVTKKNEGQGFATAIARAVIDQAIHLGHRQLWASVDEDHLASQAVLKKTNFQFIRRVEEDPAPFLIFKLELNSAREQA